MFSDIIVHVLVGDGVCDGVCERVLVVRAKVCKLGCG